MKRSLTEIAGHLGLNLDTLDRWIRQGKIPVNKQGDMGIYNVSELNRWADKQRKTSLNSEDKFRTPQGDMAAQSSSGDLSDLILLAALKRGGIFQGVKGEDKGEILKAAVDLIPDYPGKNNSEILDQLMEREKLTSTGIGEGVAIPHPRNPLSQGLTEPMIVTCFPEKEIPFQSIDDQPVFVIFLMLSPTVEIHLNMLSRLSFCLRHSHFIRFIRQAPDAEHFLSCITEMENRLENRGV